MNFTKTTIRAIQAWVMDRLRVLENKLSGGVKYSETQALTEKEKQTARDNIGFDDTIVDALVKLDVLPVLLDGDGEYLADGDGALLLLPDSTAKIETALEKIDNALEKIQRSDNE